MSYMTQDHYEKMVD